MPSDPRLSLALSSIVALAACDKPSAHAKIDVHDDGVHILAMIDGVDEVEIAGRTVRDGETIVVPFAELDVGLTEVPIIGKGLEGVVTHVDLPPNRVLDFRCPKLERRASLELVDAQGKSPTPNKLVWFGCDVVGGKVIVPFGLTDGFELALDQGEVVDGELHIDLRPTLWAAKPNNGVPRIHLADIELVLSLTSPSGKVWSGKLIVKDQSDTLGTVLPGASKFGEGMPEASTLAVMRVADRWWFEGEAATIGQADLWVHVVEQAEPVAMKNCTFQELALGNAAHTLKVSGIAQTFVAVDRQGNELGRKQFEPKGCPDNVTLEPGQTELTVVPSEALVREWVKSLRAK
jgi:hypothetical protein